MAFTQQQAIALLSLLSGGRLITELEELLSLNTNDNFVAINSGSNDAKRIKIPLLRGYKGTYDASTNTPNLSNTSTDGRVEGDMYIVSVAGSTNFGGGTVVNLLVDDIIIYLNGKYVKVTGSLDLQGAYNNSSTKTITVDDIADGTLTLKDSATNSYRDRILQVKDTSDNTLFYVHKDAVYIKDKLGIGTETPTEKLEVDGNILGNIVKATSFFGNDFSGSAPVLGIKGKGSGQAYAIYTSATDDSKRLIDFLEASNHSTSLRLYGDGTINTFISAADNSYFNIGNLGVGTNTPSEKLEVNGNIYINADTQQSGQSETPTIIFKSKNTQTATAQARIFSYNAAQDKGNLHFQVETSSGIFDTGLILSTTSGKLSAIIPTDLQVAEELSFTGGNRTFNDLPNPATKGMISYITDADGNTSNTDFVWRGQVSSTTVESDKKAALVFYDGSDWIYH